MIDAMLAWFAPNKDLMLWNEVIASKPKTLADEVAITQAVFYITTPEMNASIKRLIHRVGRRNADGFDRPLLRLDAGRFRAGGPLFVCAPETVDVTESLSSDDEEEMVAAGALAELEGKPRRDLYDALLKP